MQRACCLCPFFALSAAVQVHAQAFDGDSDRKFFLGYTNVGGKNGVELGYENGINDYLSYGAKYAFIVDKSVESNDDGPTFYDNSDLGFYLNFHLMEPLKLPDNFDIYMGPVISLKTMSFQNWRALQFWRAVWRLCFGTIQLLSNACSERNFWTLPL